MCSHPQIIPKGDQLPKFLDKYEKMCNDINKDRPAESIIEDASFDGRCTLPRYLDGRFTLSTKGVHFAETQYGTLISRQFRMYG